MATITTKFNIGDVAYFYDDARKGNMIPVIIEKIMTEVLSSENSGILYQVGSNTKFHKSEGYENDLLTYTEAKEIARVELEEQKAEIQYRIDNL